jgi:ACT domain-containing protein
MIIKKAIGRPSKVNYKTIIKLADSIQHNSTITEACRYAGISRDTYYRHLNTESVFSQKMGVAKKNQNKAVMSFLTIH